MFQDRFKLFAGNCRSAAEAPAYLGPIKVDKDMAHIKDKQFDWWT
jgi:hypothetical protein